MHTRMVKINVALAAMLLLFVSVVALRAVIGPRMTWEYDEVFPGAGELSGVAATGADDIWVAGDGYLLHDDGAGWRRRPMPTSLADSVHRARFDAVDSGGFLLTASAKDGHTPRMARWDGTRWTALPKPPGNRAVDVRAFAADDIWVLDGRTGASHWDGTRWTAIDLPVTVTALDGVAPGDLWAVGHHYPHGPDESLGLPGAQPATMHWDGRAWKRVPAPEYHYTDPAPEELAYFTEVAALAKDDVRAYGEHTSISEDDEPDPAPESVRLRWNGTSWIKLANSGGACGDRGPWVDDGERGAVLSAGRYLTADGRCEGIARTKPPNTDGISSSTGRPLRLNAITAVPGTDRILGVGSLGDSSVIVSLKR
ncbi:beta propeller repeat protein [Streptomyces europaeiscabiei]|uniref:hypothetical protein n=1 Tax=Streptomyces europaeiscabiei TaxID=146819 RepID=UPI0029A65827|nr:hypothetical protein [Streptomyces europaeiscabiei]MDX3584951.1 hypothetical protein [Streptomyces europaeiscabiei]MDX3612575.1 hypothetical protein [Streptomyces europaeiscabiei]